MSDGAGRVCNRANTACIKNIMGRNQNLAAQLNSPGGTRIHIINGYV